MRHSTLPGRPEGYPLNFEGMVGENNQMQCSAVLYCAEIMAMDPRSTWNEPSRLPHKESRQLDQGGMQKVTLRIDQMDRGAGIKDMKCGTARAFETILAVV